jgi:hypothetical protein
VGKLADLYDVEAERDEVVAHIVKITVDLQEIVADLENILVEIA